ADKTHAQAELATRACDTLSTCISLHPVLEACFDFIRCDFVAHGLKEDDVDYDKEWSVLDLAYAREFATYPPLKEIFVDVGGGDTIKKKTGVTVKDFLKCVEAAWDTEAYFETWEGGQEGSTRMSYGEAICTLSDHNGWTGWRPAFISKGKVSFLPYPYDSSRG
ncbi:hypothetical protein P7C70_g7631, partial [Phenoliferia sp. Uapishka_3]